MNTSHHTKARRLIASLGVAAAPALMFVGAGTAHADDPCSSYMQGTFYCYQQGGMQEVQPPAPLEPSYTPVQSPFGYNNLPGCSGGGLAAIYGVLSGDGC